MSISRIRGPGVFAEVVLLGLSATVATAAEPPPSPPADIAAQLRAQQQQIERQRAEIERQKAELDKQREALDQQQKQLDSLAAAIEARQPAPAVAAAAPEAAAPAPAAEGLADRAAAPGRGLHFAGYADMNYQRGDVYQNAQSTSSRKQATADLARFVLAPHYDFGHGWSFFGELEVEHGGTGSAVDYESEETGEFETEVEHGGEVDLEQLYLQFSWKPWLNVRLGELVVPVGMIQTYHQPTEYFTVERSLGETTLLPSVWHETGIQLLGSIGRLRYQLQGVTALDSTGFSGYDFVVGGMQNRFEGRYANAFALVAQAEYSIAPGALVGAAFYMGDSTPNRPRANLGVEGEVTLAELHTRYERGPVTVRAQYLVGYVQNSAWITKANLNTFNGDELGTSRTAVGKRAHSWFVEAGYDLLPLIGAQEWGRLDLFGRYDDYDTNDQTASTIARVLRYDRTAYTFGLNYKPWPGVVFKSEYQRRRNAAAVANKEEWFGFGAGFEF